MYSFLLQFCLQLLFLSTLLYQCGGMVSSAFWGVKTPLPKNGFGRLPHKNGCQLLLWALYCMPHLSPLPCHGFFFVPRGKMRPFFGWITCCSKKKQPKARVTETSNYSAPPKMGSNCTSSVCPSPSRVIRSMLKKCCPKTWAYLSV